MRIEPKERYPIDAPFLVFLMKDEPTVGAEIFKRFDAALHRYWKRETLIDRGWYCFKGEGAGHYTFVLPLYPAASFTPILFTYAKVRLRTYLMRCIKKQNDDEEEISLSDMWVYVPSTLTRSTQAREVFVPELDYEDDLVEEDFIRGIVDAAPHGRAMRI